jgi:hypothetical protein
VRHRHQSAHAQLRRGMYPDRKRQLHAGRVGDRDGALLCGSAGRVEHFYGRLDTTGLCWQPAALESALLSQLLRQLCGRRLDLRELHLGRR